MELPFPAGTKPEIGRVADWAEFQALSSSRTFKRGNLSAAIAIEDVENPDLLEQEVWSTLEKRAILHGARWPLALQHNRLTRRRPSPVDLTYYRYLLCLGLGQIDREDRSLFERLAAEALSTLTGHDAMHVGHPASEGMDPSFRKRVEAYVANAGLLENHEVISPPLRHDKDLGLDAVSWCPFSDARSGELHFLVQCATGDDWVDKLHDLDLDVWKRHINWAVLPVRLLACCASGWMITSGGLRDRAGEDGWSSP